MKRLPIIPRLTVIK